MADLSDIMSHIIDVPNAPGVPAMTTYSQDISEPMINGDAKEVSVLANQGWGVFNHSGELVLDPDNILGVEYARDWRVADYPMESGEFGSYNKVATPFAVRVMMSKGGSLTAQQAFERTLQGIENDLILYSVVTPQRTYLDVNIMHVSNARSADRGAGLMTYEIGFIEIRESGGIEFDDDEGGDATTAAASPDSTVPKTTPGSPASDGKKPVVKSQKLQIKSFTKAAPPAYVVKLNADGTEIPVINPRRISRGSAQSSAPSKAEENTLIQNGFKKLPNGGFYLPL